MAGILTFTLTGKVIGEVLLFGLGSDVAEVHIGVARVSTVDGILVHVEERFVLCGEVGGEGPRMMH